MPFLFYLPLIMLAGLWEVAGHSLQAPRRSPGPDKAEP